MLLSYRLSPVFNVQNYQTITSNCVHIHYMVRSSYIFSSPQVSRFLLCVCFSVVSFLLSRLLLFNGVPFSVKLFLFVGFPFTVTFFASHWFCFSFYCHDFCFSSMFPFSVTLFAFQSLSSRFLLVIGVPFPFSATFPFSLVFLIGVLFIGFPLKESRLRSMFKTLFLIGKSLPYNPQSQKTREVLGFTRVRTVCQERQRSNPQRRR